MLSEKKLKYLDKDQKTINDVFETLCFNFCAISEKKLKYFDKNGKKRLTEVASIFKVLFIIERLHSTLHESTI